MSKPTNPQLYEKAKEIVYAKYSKPSAYRSGATIKKYKELGGTFEGGDKPRGKLHQWFMEKWQDVNPDKTPTSYPVYRPTKKINPSTPLTVNEIDPQNLKEQSKLKQVIKGQKNLPPFMDNQKYEELKKYSNPRTVLAKGKKAGYDIHVSPLKTKKYMIITPEGKKAHFGFMGMEDYTKHKNEKRKDNFKKRNAKWATADKYSPAYLSYYLLW